MPKEVKNLGKTSPGLARDHSRTDPTGEQSRESAFGLAYSDKPLTNGRNA
jgi:hypothetical protein